MRKKKKPKNQNDCRNRSNYKTKITNAKLYTWNINKKMLRHVSSLCLDNWYLTVLWIEARLYEFHCVCDALCVVETHPKRWFPLNLHTRSFAYVLHTHMKSTNTKTKHLFRGIFLFLAMLFSTTKTIINTKRNIKTKTNEYRVEHYDNLIEEKQ